MNAQILNELLPKAEAGDALAQEELAFAYIDHDEDNASAVKWLEKAEEQGRLSVRGAWILGVSYDDGRGVPKDSSKAERYDDAMEEVWPQLQLRDGAEPSTNRALTISFDTMLKAVLKDGPVNGLHCTLVFSSVTAYTQCRLSDLFQHKILFRTSAQEAINLMPAAQAIHYAKLASNQYRYFNGLDCNTYRPYFHRSLEWDNLTMDISGDIHPIHQADEDDYLF